MRRSQVSASKINRYPTAFADGNSTSSDHSLITVCTVVADE
ncbi:Uncharacterised protein [Mycobacteroides abscessus subsp. abscessus]|nr:Uncharacterised protein [Mycobacteroides abscessus subsp. abscessus]